MVHFPGGNIAHWEAGVQGSVARERARSEIELSAGTVEYEDTGGDGPVIVFLHGLMMDA